MVVRDTSLELRMYSTMHNLSGSGMKTTMIFPIIPREAPARLVHHTYSVAWKTSCRSIQSRGRTCRRSCVSLQEAQDLGPLLAAKAQLESS